MFRPRWLLSDHQNELYETPELHFNVKNIKTLKTQQNKKTNKTPQTKNQQKTKKIS